MMELAQTQTQPSPDMDGAPEALPDRPDISFIVATYNTASFVRQALQSALDQRGAAVEIVVLDDASTDGTADIVAAMAQREPRIVLIRSAANRGPSAARNQAMARARGRWLAILDGDDLVLPERSRALLDLAALSGADVVADNFERFFTEDGRSGGTMVPRGAEPYAFTVDAASFLRANHAFGRGNFTLGAVKGMFRADFLKAHAITHREGLDFGEDFHFILKCLQAGGRFVVTSEVYYKYRKHRGSQSWRMKASHLDQLRLMIAEEDLEHRSKRRLQPEFGKIDAKQGARGRARERSECVSALEHFPVKWMPVYVAKMRRNKEIEPRSDSIGTEKALDARDGPDAELAAAARGYARSFAMASNFVDVVDLLKRRRIGAAFARIATQPAIWPLLLRHGGAAMRNRVTSFAKAKGSWRS